MDEGSKWDLGRRTQKIHTDEIASAGVELEKPGVPPASFRRMGMWLLLASLGMLFGASLIGFLILRSRAAAWPPPGSPPLPGGLWVSTALLVILSFALLLAVRAARSGRQPALQRMLMVSTLLALGFLVAQISNWMRMAASSVLPDQNLLVWFFYALTFLHAAHVLFGLIPLVVVTIRAGRGRYTADDHESVHLVGMYWHFLLVTWIAIMVVLSV